MAEDVASFPSLEFIQPSGDMTGLVHSLFIMRTIDARTEEMMPAYSGQLLAFVEGGASVDYPEAGSAKSSDLTLSAPMLRAAAIVLEGPVLQVGASLSPLGWAAFSGMAADEVHDSAFPVEKVVPNDLLKQIHADLARCRAGRITPVEYCRALEDFIRSVCLLPGRMPSQDHVTLLAAIETWLDSAFSPPVKDLYASVSLGQRQVQRLCRRYYGVPPAQLVKRYRAIRAAMLLANDQLSGDLRDEVLEAYFDQAHLIHDVRRYTGRTPKMLAKERLAQEMLDPDGHGLTGRKLLED